MKFKNFYVIFSCFFLLFFTDKSFSRENFEFDLGQKINILSDKAFRKSSENEFEAVGNVVITHMRNSIYGERARINFSTGDAEIIGNVRYVAPNVTFYGTSLKYNFITRQIDLDNARVISDNFVVTGKKIIQKNGSTILGNDAEYTTCKDCPESWSVFGRVVKIDLGKYINIKHAYLKINGVIAMYVPYVVFPIKQKRESGVLFPNLGFSSKEGFRYQQPFFLAINDSKDLTITPSTFGTRGVGGEFQYRQSFKEKTWLEINTLQLSDKIYEPYKSDKSLSGNKYFRHFSDAEFHFIHKHIFNSHFYYTNSSDLDTLRDFDFFSNDKNSGAELGGGGFIEARASLFSINIESYFNRNMLVANPRTFDDRFVQLLPKITFSTVPYNIFQSDFLPIKNLALGMNSDYSIFKQNKVYNSELYIRNARRVNLNPYIKSQLGNLGPIFFSNQIKLDYQSYHLPTEQNKRFSKNGIIYETEAKFELDRIFGLAYIEEGIRKSDSDVDLKYSNIIGDLPKVRDGSEASNAEYVAKNSYRHSQEFKFKHYYLSNQKYNGNTEFYNQIAKDEGQFDYIDAIREREYVTNQVTAQDSLPLSNTIEFQWNNRLTRKSASLFDPFSDGRYLKDNFTYSNLGFLEFSQGLDMNIKSSKFIDHLTRLYLNTGLNLDKFSVSIQEFFFHRTSEHKLASSFQYNLSRSSFGLNFTYNSFNSSNTPVAKLLGSNASIQLNDLFNLKAGIDYNIQNKTFAKSNYSLLYSPLNNCWKVELNYVQDLIDKKFGFLFYINYNENNFTSLNVR